MALLSIQVAAAALFIILARSSILATELRKQQRQLVDITHAGDDADPSVFPLQECQSDCDSDWDCEFGLICFQRAGDEEVSNCGGTPQTAFDYCVQPSENQLVIAGNNGLGSWPLKECQGDCDTDDECEGLLKCFQRNANEAVPGCEGTGDDLGSDYCYNDGTSVDPTVSSSTLDPTGDPTLDPTDPTDPSNGGDDGDDGNCDSDCNSDWDCEFGEVCVQRVDANKPGCSNTEASGIVIGYCITPNIPNLLVIAGNNGDGTSPLQKCQGDCDSDLECEGDLVCFQRAGSEGVPGCLGTGDDLASDYCYDVNSEITDGSSSPAGPPGTPTTSTPTPSVMINLDEYTQFPTTTEEADSNSGTPTSSAFAITTNFPIGLLSLMLVIQCWRVLFAEVSFPTHL